MNAPLDQTGKTADRIRDELLVTLHELDRRRHLATNVPYQLQAHLAGVLLGAGVLALGVGATVVVVRLRARSHRSLLFRQRIQGLMRAWEHPKRIATRAADRPLPAELLKKVVLIFATAIAARLARSFVGLALPVRATVKKR